VINYEWRADFEKRNLPAAIGEMKVRRQKNKKDEKRC